MTGTARLTTAEMLERLVAFDSTSRNSNLPLIGFVREYLDGHGVAYRVSTDAAGQKANIHAVIGPQQPGGVALSGHVDTVPVDGQAWTGDPFALRRQDGKLVARGAVDMKGFVASCLAAVPELTALPLTQPIHLFISYDEETNCAGARRLVQDIAESGLQPALCVVGEATGMKPVIAHKGRLSIQVEARGAPGHSSNPGQGVNAVQEAARAVLWLADEARRFAVEGPFEDGFEPPHTTVHVGNFHGGTALNIIPELARFAAEWRTIPADDAEREFARLRAYVAERIEPGMKAVRADCGFRFEVEDWLPGLSLPSDHALTAMVKQLTGSNSVGKVSYGTEAGVYQQSGIAAIVCGPGNIAQAHQPDEWIAESELAACDAFIRRLAARLAAP